MLRINLVIIFGVLAMAGNAIAGQWLYHHSDEINGRIVETDSKKPVDGALIIAVWKLEDVVNEGPGGYERVEVCDSDKQGYFTIPSWTTFKPWQLLYKLDENSPYILLFKPGYKTRFSNKPSREGHPDTIALTAEEKIMIREGNRLDPAKLVRITNDNEQLASLRALKDVGFPGNHFRKNQLLKIFALYEAGIALLSDQEKTKAQLKKSACEQKLFYTGGRCEE